MFSTKDKTGAAKTVAATHSSGMVSHALEWLWQHFQDEKNLRVLDCGRVRQTTLDHLFRRDAKVHVADLVTPLLESDPTLWDHGGKQPKFLVDKFLEQFPPIAPGSISFALCWHLLDLTPREALSPLVERLCSYLRQGGMLFCLLREPYLSVGSEATWWLEGPTTLGVANEARGTFRNQAVSNREMERLVPSGTIKTFLTRSGRREVLAFR
ncbi:MAG TPA: hypothetical protein VFD30_21880 [Terriglobia bacterium]|jgi:hypothetical protein|nr:hypothetical protein [Terriglobia bacterium]